MLRATKKNSFLYSQRIGKYSCNVSAPKYLRFRGNYTVANENGIILIVWPHTFFSWKTDYGIDFGDGDSGYRFYIDNNINYLRDETMRYSKEEEEAISRILDENRSEIEDMFELIENEWGIK